ncbi:MAG: WecB/TagA/CpsF family glycosyltransferase [Spirochaetes bacterium]|nr:WecB/TagA/CpsF family glycosyltransferase [Spirochaetota bacterium]
MNRIIIGGLLFNKLSYSDALNELDELIKNYDKKKTKLICFANQDVVARFNKLDQKFINDLNDFSIILPDGQSIILASRLLGNKLIERVTGPDFMKKFMEHSAERGYKNFFLGAKDGVAKRMSDNFLKIYPDLKVCGIYSPPFGDFSGEENDKIIKMVNNSKADVLWISFGCPKQEKWALQNIDKLKVPVSACVGAAFNLHAGIVKRAPLFLQKLGFEWLYRLFQEPGRLWKRYLVGGMEFVFIILKQIIYKKNKL